MSNQLCNNHDGFFKRVLGEPELAGTFLREHLPADVAELLGPEPPEPVPGSFVDEELREHLSDLLYRVRLKAGCGAFAYVLMEHKSTPDRGARLQLLRYVVRILTDWYDKNGRRLPLPPVLPLLVNQGPQGWAFSSEFMDLFGAVPEPVRPYLPAFRHALVDLSRVDDRCLSAEPRLRAHLKALKYTRRLDINEFLDLVFAEAYALRPGELLVILRYVDKNSVGINHKRVREVLSPLVPETEEIMGCLTQPFYDEGKAAGRAEGKASALALMLEERYGALPDSIRQRIFAASVSAIDSWLVRFVNAPDLQSVFETN